MKETDDDVISLAWKKHFLNARGPAGVIKLLEQKYYVGTFSVVEDCEIGEGTMIWHHCNLYRCTIGENCEIGSFVEIGEGVIVGDNCKILPYAFLCPGVTVGNRCFIGPHVIFCNDRYPTIVQKGIERTFVADEVSIGAGTVILSGIQIAQGVMVGAGSLVTRDLVTKGIYYGRPAIRMREL